MPFTVTLEDLETGKSQDFWSPDRDVYPDPTKRSLDVELIQAFLVAYFTGFRAPSPSKTRAAAIITRSGKRFDDGIYGPNTRAVMRIFEEDMRAPFKDGIVRVLNVSDIRGDRQSKLMKLNFMWNMTMLSEVLGTTKKETGRRALRPALFNTLYPGG